MELAKNRQITYCTHGKNKSNDFSLPPTKANGKY